MWKSEVLSSVPQIILKIVFINRNTGPQHINGSELESGHTDPSEINFHLKIFFIKERTTSEEEVTKEVLRPEMPEVVWPVASLKRPEI